MKRILIIPLLLTALLAAGCCCNPCGEDGGWFGRRANRNNGPGFDRPFPLGQVTDSWWETQQTNAEAADFIFYDHAFAGETARLTPAAKKHLMSVALRLEHVPFPVVIEESENNSNPKLDQARRQVIVEQLARIGVPEAEKRVVISQRFAEGFTAMEGESAYYSTIGGGYGGNFGRRGGAMGGLYR